MGIRLTATVSIRSVPPSHPTAGGFNRAGMGAHRFIANKR
jgi:hypothetical protein